MEVEALPSGDGPGPDAPPRGAAVDPDVLAAQVEAIEEERKRLARSLNDGPSQSLSNLVLRAEGIERLLASDPAQAREESQQLREAAVFALAEIRRLMFEAYPSVLEDLGLVQTLRRYLQIRSGPDRIAVELRVEGDDRRLPPPAELALFRAAQEAIAGAERSGGREMLLAVAFLSDAVEVTVTGASVDSDAEGEGRSAALRLGGLAGVRARLAAVGGALSTESASGRTVSLRARVPH